MPRPRCPRALAASVGALALLLARPALATWPHDPAVNVPACIAAGTQDSPVSCSDGAGGVFIAWRDKRSTDYDIYAQHLTAAGTLAPGWATNGNAICVASTDQVRPGIVADGVGGAIIVWQDGRSGNGDIYAQRVNAVGTTLWTSGGVQLSTSSKAEDTPVIDTDGSGGAIVAWALAFTPGTDTDVYANRVTASGAIATGWPAGGLAIIASSFNEFEPCIASDAAGGAIIAWVDNRSGASNEDIYSLRVTGAGAIAVGWTSTGVPLCRASGNQLNPGILADGAGGAIAYWEDSRAVDPDLYANRVTWLGTIATGWSGDGAAVVARADYQYEVTAVADGSGGALFAWSDQRFDSGDIFAQHLNGFGAVANGWPTDGRALCTAANFQLYPRAVSDGSGGAIVCWQDGRSGSGSYNVYAGRVTAAGVVPAIWPVDGVQLSTAPAPPVLPRLVADASGGAIAAWTDPRTDPFGDVFAQRIDHFGPLGNPEPGIAAITDIKADQGGQVLLKWNASYLDADPDYTVGSYWIWRQVPASFATRVVAAGGRWLDGSDAAAMNAATGRVTRAVLPGAGERLFMHGNGVDAAAGYAWEYVSSQPGSGFPQYSCVVPTAADSVTGHNPYTIFMVQARAAGGTAFWNSAADSGYSVDNLPPLPPAPFTGTYAGGATALHWGVNLESDFAVYRLYRGGSAGFVPGPGNRIAAQPDTGFADPGPAGNWYKLSAVDSHGNESAFAVLGPGGTLAAPGSALPRELAFELGGSNPAMGAASFRLALPRPMRVRLGLYDAGGRLVSVVTSGAWPAGERVLEWSGTDRAGRAAASGVYFARLEAEGRVLTRRVVLMR